MEETKEKKNLKLVFVAPVMENQKTGTYMYKLYYSDNPDVVWGGAWDYENPSLADDEDIYPEESTYSKTEVVDSDYKWGLAMRNACYPLLYCTPENGRCVLKFGMDYEEVQEMLKNTLLPKDV